MSQLWLSLALLLSLVQLSVTVEAANCTAQYGIDCVASDQTCGEESIDYVGSQDAAFSYCDPLMNAGYIPTPKDDNCPVAANNDVSTIDEGAPTDVIVTFRTVNYKVYDIVVQWSHSGEAVFREGYQVTVARSFNNPQWNFLPRTDRFWFQGKDARNFTISTRYTFNDQFHSGADIRVKVAAYPLPISDGDRDRITALGCSDCRIPRFCNDIVDATNCNPPSYPPPNNVELQTLVYNASGTEIKRLDIRWDPVTPFSEPYYQHSRYTVTYYVKLYYNMPNLNSSEAVKEHHVYKVKSNSTSRLLSISLWLPLNNSVLYTTVSILAHFPCAGISFLSNDIKIGCGDSTMEHPVPPPVFPSLPTTTSSRSVDLQPTSTIIPPTSTIIPQLGNTTAIYTTTVGLFTTDPIALVTPNAAWIWIIASSVSALILIGTVLILILLYLRRPSRKSSNLPPFISPYPAPLPSATSSLGPLPSATSYLGPLPSATSYLGPLPSATSPLPSPTSSLGPWKAVVVYSSLCDEEEVQYIISSIVNALSSRQGIQVSFPDDNEFLQGCVVSKLENKVREADAVIIICNEAFEKDWKACQTPLVNALKQLVASNVGCGPNGWNKFAVVIFDNEHEYIPSSFLSNLATFNIGEIGKDQTNRMMHFVTNTPLFEVPSPPNGPISPQSNITMRLCDTPEHSLEMDSPPRSEATLSTSVSSHNSVATHSFRASSEPA